MSERAHQLLYDLHRSPPLRYEWIYAGQWIAFTLGIVLVTTTIIGTGMGLSTHEVVSYGSRVLVVTGLATLLQCYLGHGYPIIEGPGAIYWAMYLLTTQQALSGAVALREIEGAMLVAGAVVVLFARSRLLQLGASVFTPTLSGTTLVLISASFLIGSAQNLIGVSAMHPRGSLAYLGAVVLIVILGALVSLVGRGLSRTMPLLLTAIASYVLFVLFGFVDFTILGEVNFFEIPRPFAWGLPLFRLETILIFAVAALLTTVNTLAGVTVAENVYGHQASRQRVRDGIFANGVSQIIAGVGAAAGTATLASSISVVSLSGVGSRRTIVLASAGLILLGFTPLFSALLMTIPLAIVNAIFLLVLANLFTLGLDQLASVTATPRLRFVAGLAVMAGLAVTYIPAAVFEAIPFGGSLLLGNPIIVGTIFALVGEHILFGPWTETIAENSMGGGPS